MHTIDINNIGIDRVGNDLCFFGKIEWVDEDEVTNVKISFDSFPCKLSFDMINLLRKVPFVKSDIIELPGLYLHHENIHDKEQFNKIMREIFAIAMASIPSNFIDIDISIKEDWEEA